VEERTVAGRFVECEYGNVATLDTPTKRRVVRQADNRVPKTFRRDAIDQVYQSVFKSARIEAIDYVGNQRHALGSDHGGGGLISKAGRVVHTHQADLF
jgi:hypothetical protein